MSVSAAQTAAFYEEVEREGFVWAVRDAGGIPAPMNAAGERAMPFWSLKSRAERIISQVRAYKDFEPVEIDLEAFRERWLPDLATNDIRVGLNWVGVGATGFDFLAIEVAERLVTA